MLSIAVSCVGETWVYYLLGSAVEVVLLGVIARSAWTWPAARTTPCPVLRSLPHAALDNLLR